MIVLGVAQDGGYPHIGCQKECCTRAWKNDSLARSVVSLALVDPSNKKWWLFEATPDITRQLHQFQQLTDSEYNFLPDGIFITHAHIGHYTGLMYLGKEAMNTKDVSVYVLPKMKSFLENNGPWSQLVNIHNIKITALTADSNFNLSDGISVIPFTVPHRDEYSETAGFRINAGERKYLFIPDIDKWQKWNKDIVEEVKQVDVAFLDGTFLSKDELPGRDLSSIPHPLVTETMELFSSQSEETKKKIYFIHFNHTNPLMWDDDAAGQISGFNIAKQGMKL